MAALDHWRTLNSRKAWAESVSSRSSRQNTNPFTYMEEYVPYRAQDVGGMSLHLLLPTVDGISGSNSRMMTFAMTSTIPEQEPYLCQQLIEPVRIVIDLHNDLLSWEEEIRAAQKTDQAHSTNTIWELAEKQSLNKHDARTLCQNSSKRGPTNTSAICSETILGFLPTCGDIWEPCTTILVAIQYKGVIVLDTTQRPLPAIVSCRSWMDVPVDETIKRYPKFGRVEKAADRHLVAQPVPICPVVQATDGLEALRQMICVPNSCF